MNKLDLLRLSLGNLWRRKVRTLLTVLGVVIGTSSIVVMISLGLAMDAGFQEQIQNMGDLTIIEVSEGGGRADAGNSTEKVELNEKYVAKIRKIPGVQAVMGSRSVYVRIVVDKKVNDTQLVGIDPAVQADFGFTAEQGRLLEVNDKDALLFGPYMVQWFYNPRSSYYGDVQVDVLTDKMELTTNMSYGERRRAGGERQEEQAKVYKVRGVGILEMKNGESDYRAYTSLALVDKIQNEAQRSRDAVSQPNKLKYDNLKVKVADLDSVESVQDTLKEMGFNTYSMIEFVREMQQTSRRMQAILGGIGAISLFVAAIGITNTMVMSIYERTREIGVIKVLGASLRDIRDMFLLESAAIGVSGGIFGLLLSCGISCLLNHFGAQYLNGYMYGGGSTGISLITWQLALGAILFSMLIGLIAGYSPARRAMNMPVLEALRSAE